MSLAMSEHERQEFLAGIHVGVISIERADGPPLTVPIWYGYEPGGLVWIITGAESRKGRLLNAARRFSLCVQTEEPPFYKYVSVEGPIVDVAPAELETDRRPLAHRYFGPELGDAYVASNDGEGSLKFSMRPTRWWSVDYTKPLLSATRPPAIMASGFGGRYQGLVVDDADPIGEHRLRVIVPEVWGTEAGAWAVPSLPPGGAATPAVGNLVWVTFEGGDPKYPIWVGVSL